MSLIAQIAVFLGATVLAIPLFRRLRLSSILGYLAAGVVIGAWGRRIVQDTEGVMHIAEFGVVLLLFVIGLELQPSRLRAMRKAVFGLGLAQVSITTAVFALIAFGLGLPANAALVTAFALSLSSTPLVLQLLAERQQLNTHYGRSSFGVLLFQDIAVMPMLAILPLLGGEQQTLTQTLLSGAKGLAVLAALVFGGRYVLRPVLRIVAETKVSEAFTAAALFVVLGTALLVNAVGLSMALGAFVAGLLLADSEYRHELEADIEPFKGLLLGLFFMSVGLSANLGLLLEQPGRIALLVAGLIAVKFALLYSLARFTGHSPDSARGMAFALPQAGEFGFVLFSLAVAHRVMDPTLAETLVIVVTISMIVSPLLMSLNTNVLEPRLAKPEQREFDRVESQDSRVIVAGFGRMGQIVGRVLRMRRITFTALEKSVAQVDFVRRFGNKVYYGDASAPGSAAGCRCGTRGGVRAHDRRYRRIGTHRRAGATAFPQSQNHGAGAQPATRVATAGYRCALSDPRDLPVEPRPRATHAGSARHGAYGSRREHSPLRRARQEATAGPARDPRRRAEADPVGAAGSARAGAVVRVGYGTDAGGRAPRRG
jgi:monovalent cation:proton antiporter-2 (CPA2) family protein